MEALQLAGLKAELCEDGLPTHDGAVELTARLAEHGDGWTVAVKDEVNAGTNVEVKAEFVRARVKTEPGTEPGLGAGPWQRGQPRRAAKQLAGPSGAAGKRKRERGHTEPARAPSRRTGRHTGREAAQVDAAGTARAGRPERSAEAPPAAAEADRPWEAKCDASWEAQLAKLKAYKQEYGDCSVPRKWTEDPPLGNWLRRGHSAIMPPQFLVVWRIPM